MGVDLILGIDLGTTSVKLCLYDPDTDQIQQFIRENTNADIKSKYHNHKKQDPRKIQSVLNNCMGKLRNLELVRKIGICGQMHGIVFWNTMDDTSPLYTWQDRRCDTNFLRDDLPQNSNRIASGYGIATIFWMLKNRPEKIKKYKFCGTIQDFLVAKLCNWDVVIMSPQNANSWGYFNCDHSEWDTLTLQKGKYQFPLEILPKISKSDKEFGILHRDWFNILAGTKVGVALGDLQCTTLTCLSGKCHNSLVINISTSAQCAFATRQIFSHNPILYCVPYFNGHSLVLGASLNGGNMLQVFVDMLQQWMCHFDATVTTDTIWSKLIDLARVAMGNLIEIEPLIFGERHCPNLHTVIKNIDIRALDLGTIFKGLCHNLITNLIGMMPKEILGQYQIEQIIGNGGALIRNPILQQAISDIYGMPLHLQYEGDAAKGAALAMFPI